MELFEQKNQKTPLADRIRPQSLEDFVGQEALVGKDGPIRQAIKAGEIQSMIFWGPPGTGKTTLAHIIAKIKDYKFISFSAVLSGVNDVRRVIKEAKFYRAQGKRTILFVDEIHRFNKAQQDAFLHCVEDGTIILIGATTENPSFAVISPLLSRTTTYVFKSLGEQGILKIIDRALELKQGLLEYHPQIDKATKEYLARVTDGDARVALNILEFATLTAPLKNGKREITLSAIKKAIQESPLLYDKKGEEHYNLISAFIKSMRGSDPDASLYWLARMIESGEDPLFIVRRMVIFAAEDIGNADPQALVLTTSCKSAIELVGMPEGFLPLSQTVAYLATAPKSNTALTSYKEALKDVKEHGSLPVPLHLRNPVTPLMRKIGYGKEYKYPHNHKGIQLNAPTQENYLPEKLKGSKYYTPSDSGFEQEIKKRMKKNGTTER
ncbi:replication-associated recombination protein A [candidate division WOR-3 bacterium]|nr:replication-associated recombination protein A [candidate division WOR-3 bacterium]